MKFSDKVIANLRRTEKAAYLISSIMLSVAAFVVFGQAIYEFVHQVAQESMATAVIGLLENILLALMLVELLHTLIVSIESKGLRPEPFLLVALVAAVRRILAISVEGAHLIETNLDRFYPVLWEIGVLTVLIFILVISIYILRKKMGDLAGAEAESITGEQAPGASHEKRE